MLNPGEGDADLENMAKKKPAGRNGDRVSQNGNSKKHGPPRQPRPVEEAAIDTAALRVGVGRGSLAEQTLDALERTIGELQRVYGEVAALGKSLTLARDQLDEQEAELEELRDSRPD